MNSSSALTSAPAVSNRLTIWKGGRLIGNNSHLSIHLFKRLTDLRSALDSCQVQGSPAQLVAPSHVDTFTPNQPLNIRDIASLDGSK